jgi:WD40 repeat protein/HEAT repeat protein
MSLTITCQCGQSYAVPPQYAGQQVDCPLCGTRLTVPGAPAEEETFSVSLPEPPSGEPIPVTCACGQSYATPPEYAGQQVSCPNCNRTLTVPSAATSSTFGGPYRSHAAPAQPARSGGLGWLVAALILILFAGSLVAGVVLLIAMQSDETEVATTTPEPKTSDSKPSEAKPAEPKTSEPKEKTPAETPKERPKKEEKPPSPPSPPDLPPPSDSPWRGHLARILTLAFTADGRSVLTAAGGVEEKDKKEVLARDSTLRRWDASTGKEKERWPMVESGIGAAAFSPDGRFAAVAGAGPSANGDIHLWDLREKRRLHILAKHTKAVRCLAFSRDGKQLLSGSDDKLLVLWNAGTGKRILQLKGHTNAPNQVVFSPNGRLALSGGMDHSARLWDLDGGRQLRDFTGHGDIVWAVAFSADGRLALTGGGLHHTDLGFVAGSRDHDVRLWDVREAKELKRFTGHPAAVTALAFNGDGSRFLSGSQDGTLRLWQIDTGKEIRRYEGHDGRVTAVAFFPAGRRAISAGEDGKLRTWALPPDLTDLVRDLRGEDASARLAAIAELARLRQDARAAIPAMFEALTRRDEKLRPKVLQVLRDLSPLGKEHVLRLDRLLQDTTFPEGRLFALDALDGLGKDASPAAKSLLAAVSDKDVIVRRKALKVLAPLVGELGDAAFRPLLDALRDRDGEVSAAAAAALDKLGPPKAEHVGTLIRLLREEAVSIRRFGLKALGDLGEASTAAIDPIAERAAKDSSAELRGLALLALRKIAPRDSRTVQACTAALNDREPAVCRQAAKGLAAAPDVPGLLKALLHSDAEVMKTAGEALDKAKFARAHVPMLIDLLDSKEEGVRQRGIEALGKLGANAGADAVPALSKVLKNAEAAERARVLAALSNMGKAARDAGEAVAELLKHKDRAVRFEACKTLIRIGATEVKQAIPVLVESLRADKQEDLDEETPATKEREKAREMLVSIGKPAIKALVYALENEFVGGKATTTTGIINGYARLEVLKVLIAIGPPAGRNDVLLVLAGVEKHDPFPVVRKTAREARVKLQRKD